MAPEFSRPVLLARLPEAGRETVLRASPAECAALARRFAIAAVERLEASLLLRPEPGGGVMVSGRLRADVVQACVVSLEPVPERVDDPVELRLLPPGTDPSDDPEGPDEIPIEGDAVDLGEAMAEQLALALDPYPRAAGAVLPGAEGAPDGAQGAFGALAALRRADGTPE
ncbi:DUF177 domain-containing protein [Roseomonas sp. CECT 9278]|uniref:YceD family protein n=1 Tax=Roseomonas sp. CECT 9278 TaxID=2845823 RepID=UPI001E5CDBCE|nr:DUF177 domain-containing protein [Roseomonas sp. CECT 9278]CAH0138795.1 hypothetical protein ROS9278_00424 [Roseomonas sp. CECT 9278]